MSTEKLMEMPEDMKEPQEEVMEPQEEILNTQEEMVEPHEEILNSQDEEMEPQEESVETQNEMKETHEEKGTVKWFDSRKRYGFIERDNGGDIFVHANGMADQYAHALEDGERVRFIVGQGPKGPAAEEVHRLS